MANIRVNFGPCSVEGCDSPAHSKSLCRMHYKRMATHGNTSTVLIPYQVPRRGVDELSQRGPSCPHCKEQTSVVKDSRQSEDMDGNTYVRRRRLCQTCAQRFTTFESPLRHIMVLPADVRRRLRMLHADITLMLNSPEVKE